MEAQQGYKAPPQGSFLPVLANSVTGEDSTSDLRRFAFPVSTSTPSRPSSALHLTDAYESRSSADSRAWRTSAPGIDPGTIDRRLSLPCA
jgi:hypothetical protein